MTSHELPQTIQQWTVTGTSGLDCLQLSEAPTPEYGENQVLVKVHAVSLNFRDTMILKGQYPMPTLPNLIPGSDAAGVVVAVGKRVTRFKPGDKVVTLFMHEHLDHPLAPPGSVAFGSAIHGALRTLCPVDELGLVPLPTGLSFLEGATLSCAGLTAWNSLYGIVDNAVKPGQWVLTQGTGGVSTFAVQFAKAAGARIIATTGSPEKVEMLQRLGAHHVINYRETPNWGEKAKELTGGIGVDHVVEVAGFASLAQSFKSVRRGGVISIVGFLSGLSGDGPSHLHNLLHSCTTRGVAVGTKAEMLDMIQAIEGNLETLRPVIDKKVFRFDEARQALEYLDSGRHQGKVCINFQ
ncbi:Zinc-type alcohol dehydrogenase-like protein [Paramyrothecium foliicola]|nr:Zinc-type alcohol dehydrogenase-like protein [Paramyrothecium foliicola]